MRGGFKFGLLAAGLLAPAVYGQSPTFDHPSNPSAALLRGFQFYGVSVYSGYSTRATPGGQIPSVGAISTLGADVNYGASTSLGWQHHRDRTDWSFIYSASYGGMVRYSDANGLSQLAAFSASHRWGAKWTFSFSATGSDMTTAQYVHQPTSLATLSATDASFGDLAAAFGIGQFANGQIASALTSSPTLQTPARSLLLGDRVLSYAGTAGLTYAHSSRLSFHFSTFTAAGQHRTGGTEEIVEQNYVMPRSLGANAGVGMSYNVSPRTELSLSVNESYTHNRYQSGYTTSASAGFGRKMGLHWFLAAHAGGSTNHVTSQSYGTPITVQMTGGGSIGFRTYQHTLIASYDRSGSDPYGFALGSNRNLSAAWNFHRRGSSRSVFASYGQQQLRNTGYSNLSGWSASGGVSQTLNAHTSLSAQYVYTSSSGTYLGTPTEIAIHSVRLSLNWAPEVMR